MSSDVLRSGSWKGHLLSVEFLLLARLDNERSPVLVSSSGSGWLKVVSDGPGDSGSAGSGWLKVVSDGPGDSGSGGSGSCDWPSKRVASCRSDVGYFYIRHRGWFFWFWFLGATL